MPIVVHVDFVCEKCGGRQGADLAVESDGRVSTRPSPSGWSLDGKTCDACLRGPATLKTIGTIVP